MRTDQCALKCQTFQVLGPSLFESHQVTWPSRPTTAIVSILSLLCSPEGSTHLAVWVKVSPKAARCSSPAGFPRWPCKPDHMLSIPSASPYNLGKRKVDFQHHSVGKESWAQRGEMTDPWSQQNSSPSLVPDAEQKRLPWDCIPILLPPTALRHLLIPTPQNPSAP